jgi:hypothetical protein
MSAERFFQVCSGISSFIILGCIIFMIIGIFKAPSLESLTGMGDDGGEGYEEGVEGVEGVEDIGETLQPNNINQ